MDLILQRTGAWRPISRALATGAAFLLAFIVVQWPFASFLMTPLARNRVFGTAYLDFSMPQRAFYARYLFFPREAASAQFWRGMLIAAVIACAMTWIGLRVGRALQNVRR